MRSTTHREANIWEWWFQQEVYLPERNDYYLMQIAQEVKRVLSKKPGDIKLEQFAFQKKSAKKDGPKLDSKTYWASVAGIQLPPRNSEGESE